MRHHPLPWPPERPPSVIITSLLLLTLVVGELCIMIKDSGLPEFRQNLGAMIYTFGSPLVYLFCAVFLYRGAKWARLVYYSLALPVVSLGTFFFREGEFWVCLLVFGFCGLRLTAWPATYFFTGKDTRKIRPHIPPPHDTPPRTRDGKYDY